MGVCTAHRKKSPEKRNIRTMTSEEFRRKYVKRKGRGPLSKLPSTSANKLTRDIIAYLQYLGHDAFRVNNVGVWDAKKQVYRMGNTRKGIPDIIGTERGTGRAIYIEVKVKRDRLSVHQQDFLNRQHERGAITIVARCLDDVIRRFPLR